MREDEVASAAMDVEPGAQVLQAHRRALDVPARPSRSPGAVPGGLIRLGALPQSEVQRIGLVLPHVDPRAVAHLGHLLLGQLAVFVPTVDVEVDVGARLVGVPFGHETGDEVDDLLDVLGGQRLHVRPAQTQTAGVFPVGVGELLGHLAVVAALGDALVDDAVVDVGDVLHQGHPVAHRLEVALGHHGHHVRPGVADVHVVVDRGTAEVHGHVVAVPGDEVLLLLGHGIVETHPVPFRGCSGRFLTVSGRRNGRRTWPPSPAG